jgi:hypothetical protein
MKKIILFIALLSVLSFAQKNNNAIGIWIGDLSGGFGVDFKHLNKSNTAWDIYLGDFRFGNETAMGLGFGYYFLYNVIKADASNGRFPLYWGPNIGLGYWNGGDKPHRYSGFDIGLSIAGGISWFMPWNPEMDLSIELISPNIGMWRQSNERDDSKWDTNYDPAFGLKGSLGIRILFHIYFF